LPSIDSRYRLPDRRSPDGFGGESFFLKAFDQLGGTIHKREADRLEIIHVYDREATG